MPLNRISLWSAQAARGCAIALGFSIPVSVALDNVLLALVLAFWLASLDYRVKFAQISRNRVALAALGLFALFVIGLAYGSSPPGAGLNYLGKYADLAFIPIFVTLFDSEPARRQAWSAFASAMILTLALSYLLWAGVVEHGGIIGDNPLTPAVFKRYLTQNVMMAFAAFLFVYLGRAASSTAVRCAWWALAVMAAVNVTLLNPGRTGQLILAVLTAYVVYSSWRWKGALLLAVAAAAAVIAAGDIDHRFGLVVVESQAWQPGAAATTSSGQRLQFYRNTLEIVRGNPLVGNGTGSFPKAYADYVAGSAMATTENPHNEYLNIAVQIGVIGLSMMLYLFYSVWRYAAWLPAAFERPLARALVMTIAIGCLFNSLLVDHVEGLFFAWASGLLFAGVKSPQPADAAIT